MRLERDPRNGPSEPSLRLTSRPPHSRPVRLPWCFSYLGDFSKDDPAVLSALPQGLHVSQEFFPLLNFLHHWTGRGPSVYRTAGAPALLGGLVGRQVASLGNGKQFGCFSLDGPQGFPTSPAPQGPSTHTPPSPPQHNWPLRGSHSSKRSSLGAGSSCRRGWGFLFRSSGSFPVAKIFWSLRFSFSRSPVGPRRGLVKLGRAPSIPRACLLQGAWEHGRASANPAPPTLGRFCTAQVTVGRKVLQEPSRERHQIHTLGFPGAQW